MEQKGGKRLTKRQVADAIQGLFQAHPGEALTYRQIFKTLKLTTHPAKMLAVDVMDEMAWDDYLSKVDNTTYRLNLKTQVQEGTFIRKANGKNSFLPDDGGKPIFVSERNSKWAMGGDRVRVALMARRQNHIKEAIVTDILERKHNQAVGILQVEKDFAFLITEGNIFAQDILIPKKKLKGGKTGEKAVVRITQWPSMESKNLVGEVVDVLGKQGDNNAEMHAILAQYDLPYKYPQRVEDAANKISGDIGPEEIARREDFRQVTTFTIDPADAKDFDDALSIRPVRGASLYEVGVHIADVTHYVTEGSIIDREELHFDVDEDGKPLRCYFKKSTDATQLIEEFMLLANRTVAESVGTQHASKTFVYRIHDQPDPQKLETLRTALAPLGYRVKVSGTRGAISRGLNKLISQAEGRREQKMVEMLTLRTMMKAKYSTHNIGHYGLAFDYYTHFTSPLRRLPDMMVHRLLTRYQEGARSANQEHYEELCEHSSDMEQTAANAERDSIKYKMVEFMADKVGQEFDAHISGVQSYGIYCEIDENHCEGLVGMHDLDGDYYEFDERNYQLVGRRHHRTYQLGDAVRIKVAQADVERRQLTFLLAD